MTQQIRDYFHRLIRQGYRRQNARERCLWVRFAHVDATVVLNALEQA